MKTLSGGENVHKSSGGPDLQIELMILKHLAVEIRRVVQALLIISDLSGYTID